MIYERLETCQGFDGWSASLCVRGGRDKESYLNLNHSSPTKWNNYLAEQWAASWAMIPGLFDHTVEHTFSITATTASLSHDLVPKLLHFYYISFTCMLLHYTNLDRWDHMLRLFVVQLGHIHLHWTQIINSSSLFSGPGWWPGSNSRLRCKSLSPGCRQRIAASTLPKAAPTTGLREICVCAWQRFWGRRMELLWALSPQLTLFF